MKELRSILKERIPQVYERVNKELKTDFRRLIQKKMSINQYMKNGSAAASDIGYNIGRQFEHAFEDTFENDPRFSTEDTAGHDFVFNVMPLEMKTTKMTDKFMGSNYSSKCDNYILIGYDLNDDILTNKTNIIKAMFVYAGFVDNKYWQIGKSKKDSRSTLCIPIEEYDIMKDGVVFGSMKVRKNAKYLLYEREPIHYQQTTYGMKGFNGINCRRS